MKKLIIILAMLLPLSGCVPVVIAAGATAGGAIIYDKRSIKTMYQDRQSTQMAQNLVNQDRYLKHRAHIAIVTYNHVTVMAGQAETPELRQRAYKLVSRVKGIKKIYNEVTIGKPIRFLTRADDDVITAKVKAAMLLKPGLHSSQIKIMTENHVVYMLGIVNKKQAKLAASVARRVSGVRKVVLAFQYPPA